MQQLSIRLFGTFEVTRDGQPIDSKEWLRRKNQSLLKFLVSYRGRPLTQEQLIEVLYPKRPTMANVRNLLARISEVRRILEPNLGRGNESAFIVRLAQGTYTFSESAPCMIDIEEYRRATRQGHKRFAAGDWGQALAHYSRAIQLYCGDFLAEDVYEEWTEPLRDEFRSLQIDTLMNTGECHLKLGAYEESAEAYQAAVELDPLDEHAYRGKMLALYHLGDLRRAIATYDECITALDEADLEPEDETIGLYQAIRKASLPNVQPETRHNLPHSATPFVGRAQELAVIEHELLRPETRCLTLLGPGGMGKTRLALETASRVLHRFPDGVFLIDTPADVTADRYASLIAESMGERLADRGNPQEQLIAELRTMRTLLIIDNGEHSLAASNLLEKIISETSVTILAASRERLHMSGEVLIEVAGLDVPGSDEWFDVERSDAARLFSDRMRRVDQQFVLNPDVASDVARICRALSGIPLALEMASAWGRALSCREIAQRIERDFSLLELPAKERHGQTNSMLGIFLHTWSQLTEDEQEAFARLSAFRGGMSSEAALHVSGKSLSVLMALRDKALLRRDLSGRYSMHELLRQFAEDQLKVDPVLLADAYRTHAGYFVRLLDAADPKLMSSDQIGALSELQVEWANITLAWQRCVTAGHFEMIASMLGPLYRMHILRSRWHELREALELALERLNSSDGQAGPASQDGVCPRPRAALQVKYGEILFHMTEYARAKEVLSSAMEATEHAGDAALHAECLNTYGRLLNATGVTQEAESFMRKSVEILRTAGSSHQLGMALCTYGVFHNQHRRYDEAFPILEESLSIRRKLGDPSETSAVLLSLGNTYGAKGDWEPARQLYMESLKLAQEVGHRRLILMANANLGQIHFNLKEYDAAKVGYSDAARIAHVTDDRYAIMFMSYYLTITCSKLGELDEAMESLQTGLEALRKEPVVAFSLRLVYAAGHLLQAHGRLEEALATFTFACNHEGTPPPARPGIETDAKIVEEMLAPDAIQRAKEMSKGLTLDQMEAWLYRGMSDRLDVGASSS